MKKVDSFKAWLFQNGVNDKTASIYVSCISSIENTVGQRIDDLLKNDIRIVLGIIKKINGKSESTKRNYVLATRKYVDFLKNIDNNQYMTE